MEFNEVETVEPTANPYQDRKGFTLRTAIEFPVLLTMLGLSMSGTPIGNLIMYRCCVHALHHPRDECRPFLDPESTVQSKELEIQVQEYATIVSTVKSVLEAIVPAVLMLFVGVWSDKHGRRPLVLWPVLGMTLTAMLTVLYGMLDNLGPWWFIGTVIPFSLSGGYFVMVTGANCFASDVSTDENRSFRLMVVQLTVAVSVTVGAALSPYILKLVGNSYLLLIVATLYTIAYVYVCVFTEESMKDAVPGSLWDIFNLSHTKEMIRVCFEKKPNNGRSIMLLIVASSSLSVFTVYGTSGLTYLYTRAKIHWTMEEFTTFSAVSSAMWFAGAFFGVAVIQKMLRISDLNFVAVAFMSCAAEYVTKAFAVKTWHMYLGSSLSLFGNIAGPLQRSFLTKAVPNTDIAKVFGLVASADSLCPLIAPILYNALYTVTITSFPGAFMLLTACIYFLCLILVMIAKYLRKLTPAVTYAMIETDEA